MAEDKIPKNIIKIQRKLATFEKGSRNYEKYTKILKKHIKQHAMKQRNISHTKSIETVQKFSKNEIKFKENKKEE